MSNLDSAHQVFQQIKEEFVSPRDDKNDFAAILKQELQTQHQIRYYHLMSLEEELNKLSKFQKLDAYNPPTNSSGLKLRLAQNQEHQWTLDQHPPLSIGLQPNEILLQDGEYRKLAPKRGESPYPEIVHSQISEKPEELRTSQKGRKRGRPVKYCVKDAGDEVAHMSIQELRDELKRKGLSPGKGYKHDLVARVRKSRAHEIIPNVMETKEEVSLPPNEIFSEEASISTPNIFPTQIQPSENWDSDLAFHRLISFPPYTNHNLPTSHLPKEPTMVENVFELPNYQGNSQSDILEPQSINPQ